MRKFKFKLTIILLFVGIHTQSIQLQLFLVSSVWWLVTATKITKRNTIDKENFTNKKVWLTKTVCFHINKICSHIQKRISLYIKKTNGNSKFSRQIATSNSCGKFLRQILVAISHRKFSICNIEDGME